MRFPRLPDKRILGLALAFLTSAGAPFASAAEEEFPDVLERIAFGSCADQSKPQPVWDGVLARKPQLFLMIGDNIYADTEDMSVMRAKYAQLAEKPGFQAVRDLCPVLSTWDDHDFGENDGGAWYPKREESRQIMLDFFRVPADSVRRKRPGVYGSYAFGPPGRRVQVILLDTRYFRSRATPDTRPPAEKRKLNLVGWYVPSDDPQATMLGDDQWKWLEEQLREPADVRLICSSVQVIAGEKGMESWGCFPAERRRLYDTIARTGAKEVVFLSGDVHFSEISRTVDGPWPLYDFTSSGLTNANPVWASAVNPHRVSPSAYAKPTFGMVLIDWSGEKPVITLEACRTDGNAAFRMTLPSGE